jgi:hypothetical protein
MFTLANPENARTSDLAHANAAAGWVWGGTLASGDAWRALRDARGPFEERQPLGKLVRNRADRAANAFTSDAAGPRGRPAARREAPGIVAMQWSSHFVRAAVALRPVLRCGGLDAFRSLTLECASTQL